MTVNGTGVFFDGHTSRRQDVHVALGDTLAIVAPDGRRLESWPLADIRERDAIAGMLRLTRVGGPPLARLDIADQTFAAAIRNAAPALGAAITAERGLTQRIVALSLLAVVSLSIFGIYGVPALANQITPLLPWSFDRRMGAAVDDQLRAILPVGKGGFACGEGDGEKEGRAVLDRLATRLTEAAKLPVPITITAVRSSIPNALALPGGYIYLFDGLITQAETPEEIAGVLAHEIGHVASRDGTRRVLHAGGTSLLFGFVLGDFLGGTVAITVAQALSEASYSRAAEAGADAYGVALMGTLKADARGLGALLTRLSGGESETHRRNPLDYLASHPATAERRKAIEAAIKPGPTEPLMDAASFEALKRICSADPPKPLDLGDAAKDAKTEADKKDGGDAKP